MVFRPSTGSTGAAPATNGGAGWEFDPMDNDSPASQNNESTPGGAHVSREENVGLTVSVECHADGGFVVELPSGRRCNVEAAVLHTETGEVSAIVDSRRYAVDAMVEGWGASAEVQAAEVTLWSRHGPVEGDRFSERQRSEQL